MDARPWEIGELAAATGLTTRTLRHDESVGLLAPVARTAGGRRLYDAAGVRRVYAILALRELGLPLAEIGRTLAREPADIGALLEAHRAHVAAEIARLEGLRALLDHACAHAAGDVAPDALLALLAAMSRVAHHAASRPADGGAEARWRALGEELRACMAAGAAATSPRSLAVARAVRAALRRFTGGDAETTAALAHLRREAPPADLAGWTPDLLRYLDDALTALGATGGEP